MVNLETKFSSSNSEYVLTDFCTDMLKPIHYNFVRISDGKSMQLKNAVYLPPREMKEFADIYGNKSKNPLEAAKEGIAYLVKYKESLNRTNFDYGGRIFWFEDGSLIVGHSGLILKDEKNENITLPKEYQDLIQEKLREEQKRKNLLQQEELAKKTNDTDTVKLARTSLKE